MSSNYGKRAVKTPTRRKSPVPVLLLIVVLLVGTVAAGSRFGLLPLNLFHRNPSPAPAAEISAEPAEASAPVVVAEPEPEPEPEPLPGEGIIVCIDPGHGGKDPGCNTEERLEKDDVLKLALCMREKMEAQGITVVMTREDDTFIKLMDRCEIANKAHANYYISVHRNTAGGVAYGNEIWKSYNATEEASSLADSIMAGLNQVGIQRDRGVQEGSQDHNGDYAVLRATNMPSVLLEMGFIENKKDNKLFDKNMDAYSESITQAVLDTWQEFHGDPADSGDSSAEAAASAAN